ncbi:MAG: SEC-C metal-binding domain-containing protein [Boseongicola sp.]|nr:SEC-C metal-binding domain-containing protein [Boseongicola sp.]
MNGGSGSGAAAEEAAMAKIGRSERCPCGSGRKYKHCCRHGDGTARAATAADRAVAVPTSTPMGDRWVQTDLDRLSNSVRDLVWEGRLDEADAACLELRLRYPEVVDWVMRKAMVCEARGETELAIECCERTIAWMDARPEEFEPASREPFVKDVERLRRSLGGP